MGVSETEVQTRADNSATDNNPAQRLGLESGDTTQEFGWDEDTDEQLREGIQEITGTELLDEDEQTVVDVVILWWRGDDGDLVDGLVDVLGGLDERGTIWLFTPKRSAGNHVEPAEVQEAAQTAGLVSTSSIALTPRWSATKLVQSGARR